LYVDQLSGRNLLNSIYWRLEKYDTYSSIIVGRRLRGCPLHPGILCSMTLFPVKTHNIAPLKYVYAQLLQFFGPGNGSPMATNVVLVVVVLLGVVVIRFAVY